jgi:hypothetical protein
MAYGEIYDIRCEISLWVLGVVQINMFLPVCHPSRVLSPRNWLTRCHRCHASKPRCTRPISRSEAFLFAFLVAFPWNGCRPSARTLPRTSKVTAARAGDTTGGRFHCSELELAGELLEPVSKFATAISSCRFRLGLWELLNASQEHTTPFSLPFHRQPPARV